MNLPNPVTTLVLRVSRLVLAISLAGGIACRARAGEVLAKVGSVEVTVEEARAYLEGLTPQERAAVTKDQALLAQVVRTYLTRQAVLREAQAKKFEQQPGVKAQLDRAREQALTDLYLDSISRAPEGYPSDAEVQAAYDANKAAFEVPRQLRVAQIYVALPKGADKAAEDAARKKIDDVAKRARAKGVDFGAIARAESEDPQTAGRGGEIGWLTEAEMVPGIRSTATSLAVDAVSEPIRLDDGWHLLKVLETRPAGARPLAEVRGALVEQMRVAKARDLRRAYLAKLLDQNPPAINELALSRVLQKGK